VTSHLRQKRLRELLNMKSIPQESVVIILFAVYTCYRTCQLPRQSVADSSMRMLLKETDATKGNGCYERKRMLPILKIERVKVHSRGIALVAFRLRRQSQVVPSCYCKDYLSTATAGHSTLSNILPADETPRGERSHERQLCIRRKEYAVMSPALRHLRTFTRHRALLFSTLFAATSHPFERVPSVWPADSFSIVRALS
jgi:hypothetical protein